MRIVSGGFFKKWEDYSVEEKINNKEFQRALEHVRSNQCSVYKGDGSEAFSQRIVAASCYFSGACASEGGFRITYQEWLSYDIGRI